MLSTIQMIIGWVLVEVGAVLLLISVSLAIWHWRNQGGAGENYSATIGFFGCLALVVGYTEFQLAAFPDDFPRRTILLMRATDNFPLVKSVMQRTWYVGAAIPIVTILFLALSWIVDHKREG